MLAGINILTRVAGVAWIVLVARVALVVLVAWVTWVEVLNLRVLIRRSARIKVALAVSHNILLLYVILRVDIMLLLWLAWVAIVLVRTVHRIFLQSIYKN